MSVLVWDPALARPKDLEDTLQLIEQLRALEEKPHPKFIALAHALLADPAFAGQWGVERMLDEASQCTAGLWEPSIPGSDGMPAIRAVIQHANALGLVAYRDSRQAVFLPGGRTVTPLQNRLHDEDFEDYDARLRKRAVACRALLEGFTRHFESHGFKPSNVENEATPRFAGSSFGDSHLCELARPIADGWQRFVVRVNDADADSEYFRCAIDASIRHGSVETIFTRVFGAYIRRADTFFFNPGDLSKVRARNFAVTNGALIDELPARVEQLAMPVLDLARDLRGLDVVMNDPSRFPYSSVPHPLGPASLADDFVSVGRQSCLKTLIVAWLVGNPAFDARVTALRTFVRTRVDVSEGDLDRLVSDLRSDRRPPG